MSYYGFAPYVSVAERRRQAQKKVSDLQKKGQTITPVNIVGRTIATTFWGKSWCDHLESYSDFENRLPRGRTYARNGSIVDLQIEKGKVKALVAGSSLYHVEITINPVESMRWNSIVKSCSGKIDSLVELLQGKISKGVMEVVTCKERGLFPSPKQISMKCSCPDWATMCKHVAAVLYGVGNRLDHKPELFFSLRNVDHMELISKAINSTNMLNATSGTQALGSQDLGSLFGIDLEGDMPAKKTVQKTVQKTTAKKPAAKKEVKKSAVKKAVKKAVKSAMKKIDEKVEKKGVKKSGKVATKKSKEKTLSPSLKKFNAAKLK